MAIIIKTQEISEEDFGAIKVKNLFNKPNVEQMSVAMIRVQGVNRKHINRKSDEFYYVLGGSGTFAVEDEEPSPVGQGDLIFIPKDTLFVDSGQMTLLVFSSPRYDVSQVEYLE
jgi:mannose-6-phosphate isomerase-like protein (cupin superfamily)